mgnify:CR=1 FL=1
MRLAFALAVPLALVCAIVPVVLAAEDDAPEAPATEPAAAPALADLAWMSGTWRADGAFEEHWTAPLAGSLLAVSRQIEGGRTSMVELSEITEEGGTLVLRLRHFHKHLVPWDSEKSGPIVWRLSESGDRRVVFEDPARAFPRSVTYERKGDVLTARLTGDHSGQPVDMTFELALVR